MNINRSTTGRIDTKPTDAPTSHEIAALLGADATLLEAFVDAHPNPTAPIVLGWACADPQLVDDVERWIADFTHRPEREPLDVPDDGRLRWNRVDDAATAPDASGGGEA